MRILGTGAGSVENRVGNLANRASGVESRLVLVVEAWGLGARAVVVLGFFCFWFSVDPSSSSSLPEAIMLSSSEISDESLSEPVNKSSFSKSACSSSICSSFCRLIFSTSTLSPRPPSSLSLSTLSQVRFFSIVCGTFCCSLSSRALGFFCSSRRLRKRSSRRKVSVAFCTSIRS